MQQRNQGPLGGIRVVEVGGMGPTPFAGMMLADLGAEVIRIERPAGLGVFPGDSTVDVLNRGKKSVVLDLKQPSAREALLALVARSDILIEGNRPGVAERLGYGPAACFEQRASLVYGRMTGWGQSGPLAHTAGHDINYIALTGALHAVGTSESGPVVPLNLVGDFGGGGMYLVAGVLAALVESRISGVGQVVDAAVADGASHLLASIHGLMNAGAWQDKRASNLLDGGAPYYAVYRTADDEYVAVGAYEEKFFRKMLRGLGIDETTVPDRDDTARWPTLRAILAQAFAAHTRKHWEEVFEGTDACVSPVLSLREAAEHPQIAHRAAVVARDGYLQPGVAPRFSRHPESSPRPRPRPFGADTSAVLAELGVAEARSSVGERHWGGHQLDR
ncbi:CaiB/BaiF CoA transferase family protein [Nocardia sp. NPDC004068]|uniref:CaiB/BaiF CoA transferase family protein n=1 Tax=Nocardia sp. NPDC004068 TaxID=3364303 RepID=UPI00369689CC